MQTPYRDYTITYKRDRKTKKTKAIISTAGMKMHTTTGCLTKARAREYAAHYLRHYAPNLLSITE